MAIIHPKLILALEYMYELSSYMHFQTSITNFLFFIASEGSKMLKSETNTLKLEQSEVVRAA